MAAYHWCRQDARWLEPGRLIAIQVWNEDNPDRVDTTQIALRAIEWAAQRLQSPFSGIDRTVAPSSLQNLPPQHPLTVELAREAFAKVLGSGRGDPR